MTNNYPHSVAAGFCGEGQNVRRSEWPGQGEQECPKPGSQQPLRGSTSRSGGFSFPVLPHHQPCPGEV